MTELIDAIFTWASLSEYSNYVYYVVFVFYALSHVVQYLPVSLTTKIPDWVMVVINLIAAKHGAVSSAKTTLAGNVAKVEEDIK